MLRRYGADGLLSRQEVDEGIEQVFRAKTLADLDALVARLPHAPHIRAEMVRTHGVESTYVRRPAKNRPWWRGTVIWSASASALWIIVWLVTGPTQDTFGIPNITWLVLTLISTWVVFSIRLVSQHRRVLRGGTVKRRLF